MRFFKNNNDKVFAFDDNQIKKGMAAGMIEISESEKDMMLAYSPTIEDEIAKQKTFLSSSDWIVTKISEEQIKGNDVSTLLTKYATELTLREEARLSINDLESQI